MLRFGGTRTTVSLDLYNALNVSTVLSQNNTFGPAWQQPNAILPATVCEGQPAVRQF